VRIDAIRELVSWLQLAAGAGRLRVAMIVSADTLNRAAANALLKTLEEPAANSVCFLLVERSAKLPATILSRCQKLPLAVSDQAATVAWLRPQLPDDLDPAEALSEAGNAPLRAVRQAGNEWRSELELIDNAWWNLLLHRQSVGRIVETVSHVPASRCLARFITLVASAVHHQCGTGQFSSLKALTSEQLAATQRLTSEQWFTIHDQLLHLYRIDNTSFKTQAVLEGFLADTRLKINR